MKLHLKPGDILLYDPGTFIDWLIALRGFNKLVHCEVYISGDRSLAVRPGIRCGLLRTNPNFKVVLRPTVEFDLTKCLQVYNNRLVMNNYNRISLLLPFTPKKGTNTCASLVNDLFTYMGNPLFSSNRIGGILPSDFLSSRLLARVE